MSPPAAAAGGTAPAVAVQQPLEIESRSTACKPCDPGAASPVKGWLARCWALAVRAWPYHWPTADEARLAAQTAIAVTVGCLFVVIDPIW